MITRTVLVRVPVGRDEIVLSRDRASQIDVRLWTDLNGSGLRVASGRDIAIPLELLPQLIEALQAALDGTEAAA